MFCKTLVQCRGLIYATQLNQRIAKAPMLYAVYILCTHIYIKLRIIITTYNDRLIKIATKSMNFIRGTHKLIYSTCLFCISNTKIHQTHMRISHIGMMMMEEKEETFKTERRRRRKKSTFSCTIFISTILTIYILLVFPKYAY